MVIGGLQNLIFASPKPANTASAGKSPEVEEGSSPFGEILDEQTDALPAADNGLPSTSPSLGFGYINPQQFMMKPATPTSTATPAVEEQSVDSLTRRAVWNDFLRKMKEDLGVSANDVMSAFASLSAEDLAKPPEQTVDQVVLALGLNDQQAMLAKQYFQELIDRTQSKSIGDELNPSSKNISLTLMSEREMARKSLENSLEKMNQNFFRKGPYTPPPQVAEQRPEETTASVKGDSQQVPIFAKPKETAVDEKISLSESVAPTEIPVARTVYPSAVETKANRPATISNRSVEQRPNKAGENFNPIAQQPIEPQRELEGLKTFKKDSVRSVSQNPVAVEGLASEVATKAVKMSESPAPLANGINPLNGLLSKLNANLSGDSSDDKDDSSNTSDASYLNLPIGDNTQALNAPISSGQDFQTQLAQIKPDQPMTVPDFVQNAQVMVREGGGEMKVTLHPEGLGEVAMKVSVDQGKVNVQMITESDEAKRLIEHQLGELKSQLTSNHLQVSDIKVDTASNLGRQMEQQYQDAQRQSAQLAWEQFRNDNQGWRRSFFEVPSASVYKGQGGAPRDVQAPNTVSSRSSNRGPGQRRLDLVA